jgi:hypothetical protein
MSMKNLAPILAIALSACTGDMTPAAEPYDMSPDNILQFRDTAELLDYLSNDNPSDFESLDEIYKHALGQLDEARTAEAHARLLSDYSDVLTLSDGRYVPVLTNSAYRRIANRDRLYISDGVAHKVLDEHRIVITDIENIDELLAIESVNGLDASRFRVAEYQSSGAAPLSDGTLADCGADLRADYFDNPSGCRNDRRAWVRAYAYFLVSGYYYTPAVISEAWAELRTGTFCNWRHYQNILHTRNCSFTVAATLNDTTYYFEKTTTDLASSNPYDGTQPESQHFIWGGDSGGAPVGPAIYWVGGYPPSIQFSSIHMESSSQGVGADHWAVIDCQ